VPRTELVLGKHSGRHALRQRLGELGYHPTDEQLTAIFEDFKVLADKKKDIYDADLEALMERHIHEELDVWELVSLHTSAGTGVIPTATLRMRKAGNGEFQDAATGDGPIDAVFRAMERITGIEVTLSDFQVRSITSGKDAQGEVNVEVRQGDVVFRGRGISTDVIEAAARAYLSVLNKIASRTTKAPTTVAVVRAS
jgi:2-isopropylmalate synthase